MCCIEICFLFERFVNSQVISKDFFLSHCADDFIEHARQLIFEMFCRIHQKISIKMLAEKLNMDEDHAERWLVNLIRNAQMDAKIDASKVRLNLILKSHI